MSRLVTRFLAIVALVGTGILATTALAAWRVNSTGVGTADTAQWRGVSTQQADPKCDPATQLPGPVLTT